MLPRGGYHLSYDWRCLGDSQGGYDADFLRVFFVPHTQALVAGAAPGHLYIPSGSLPAGYEPLDGGGPLRGSTTWSTFDMDFFIEETDTLKLVFLWFNVNLVNVY